VSGQATEISGLICSHPLQTTEPADAELTARYPGRRPACYGCGLHMSGSGSPGAYFAHSAVVGGPT
jgi:hypothetical protein